jgi:hypothetical protein
MEEAALKMNCLEVHPYRDWSGLIDFLFIDAKIFFLVL